MRIKKKFVMLESRLIDLTSEFSPQEKRILEMLYKQYGLESNFNMWDVAAQLIEDFDLDYETAYGLTRTYSWSAKELFSEYKPIRKTIAPQVLFFDNLGTLVEEYARINENNYGVNLKFKGDVGLESIEARSATLSGAYKGFYLYIPLTNFDITLPSGRRVYLSHEDWSSRGLSISISLNKLKLDGSFGDKHSWSVVEPELDEYNLEEFKVVAEYRNLLYPYGSGEHNTFLMSFNVPYPKPLTKETAFKTFDLIINDVLEKVSNTQFDLPDGKAPIDANTY